MGSTNQHLDIVLSLEFNYIFKFQISTNKWIHASKWTLLSKEKFKEYTPFNLWRRFWSIDVSWFGKKVELTSYTNKCNCEHITCEIFLRKLSIEILVSCLTSHTSLICQFHIILHWNTTINQKNLELTEMVSIKSSQWQL